MQHDGGKALVMAHVLAGMGAKFVTVPQRREKPARPKLTPERVRAIHAAVAQQHRKGAKRGRGG